MLRYLVSKWSQHGYDHDHDDNDDDDEEEEEEEEITNNRGSKRPVIQAGWHKGDKLWKIRGIRYIQGYRGYQYIGNILKVLFQHG